MKQIPVGKDEGDDPGSEMEDADTDNVNVPITDGYVRTTFSNKDDGVMAGVIELHHKHLWSEPFLLMMKKRHTPSPNRRMHL